MKKWLLALGFAALLLMPMAAQKTEVQGLYHYVLPNGLELFVFENHATPLAYIEIAVRAGGIGQTEQNAGLFHLYEHMMFKGNTKYRTASQFTTGMNDLGVPSHNGSTGSEYVNYYFTVPATKVEAGLEFWSYAIREPLLDPKELESEKGVVVSELSGDFPNPDIIAFMAMDRFMFPLFPWRRDPRGTVDVVRNCTVADLKKIQSDYYIPNNAALFVGGDVDPEQVYKLVQKIYGDWKKGADPWAKGQAPQRFPANDKPVYLVFPDEGMSDRYGYIEIGYRGPDVIREPEPTYAADVWGFLIDNPSGNFKKALMAEKSLAFVNANYVGGYYYTQRDGGQVNFFGYTWASDMSFAKKGVKFESIVREQEVAKMASDQNYFAADEYELNKQIIEDRQIIEAETVKGFLGNLRFWWASASTDYYFGYSANMHKVTHKEIKDFVTKYVVNNQPVVMVRISKKNYEKEKSIFAELGYQVITADNAFWWQK